MKTEWTHEELASMRRTIGERIEQTEAEQPNVRPLPPLAEEECREMILGMLETATERLITQDETFLFGQMLASYRMAVEARMLGRKGRYYVISEADIQRIGVKQT